MKPIYLHLYKYDGPFSGFQQCIHMNMGNYVMAVRVQLLQHLQLLRIITDHHHKHLGNHEK